MKKVTGTLMAAALLGAMLFTTQSASAAVVDCSYHGSIWIGPTIFPPIACQASLPAGRYAFKFRWKPFTSGFAVLSAGAENTTAVYFNMDVRAGFVTRFQTERGEKYPPKKPPLRGPVKGTFQLTGPGSINYAVFPVRVPAPTPALVVPAGSFQLIVWRA